MSAENLEATEGGQPASCARSNCFAPETPCNLGSSLEHCEFFRQEAAPQQSGRASAPGEHARTLDESEAKQGRSTLQLAAQTTVPWTANSLGSIDLEFVAARSKPRLIGLVGNQNAGKTTLLTVLYLLIQQGKAPMGRQFAGSFTLGGWEALAHHLRWSAGQPPRFPPHTPRGMRRMPGLLHLAFRSNGPLLRSHLNSGLEDVLLTDPPGEWFGSWSVDANAAPAEGARWIATNAESFAFLVDSEALAGPTRGQAREQLLRLVQRLAPYVQDRRVAVIWSKADIEVREAIRSTLTTAFDHYLPGNRTYEVQVPLSDVASTSPMDNESREGSSAAILDLMSWLLEVPQLKIEDPNTLLSTSSQQQRKDPFLNYTRAP